MRSVLLVSLRGLFLDSDRVFPPLGVLYLKSVLDKYGIGVEIEDDFDTGNVKKYQHFDYIAISVTTPQRKEAEEILKKVKEAYPSKKIIIGGPHASFYLDECANFPFDYIVVGDGEKSILDIVLEKSQERIIRNQLDNEAMNSLPLPYREGSFLKRYKYFLGGQETTTIITSRGCPFRCAFCEHAKSAVRYYSSDRVKQELAEVIGLGYKAVMFFDDLFAVNQKRVSELCRVIRNFNIKFRCFGHVKCMTQKMAETLAKAGCVETGVGMESGSQQILNRVKFPTPTIEQNYSYIKICHSCGIRVKAFFMLGLPGETLGTIKETEEFIANSGIDDFDLVIYYPYRGTLIKDKIKEYDLFLEDANTTLGYYKGRGGSAEASVRTSALSAEEIKAEQQRIFKTYKKT